MTSSSCRWIMRSCQQQRGQDTHSLPHTHIHGYTNKCTWYLRTRRHTHLTTHAARAVHTSTFSFFRALVSLYLVSTSAVTSRRSVRGLAASGPSAAGRVGAVSSDFHEQTISGSLQSNGEHTDQQTAGLWRTASPWEQRADLKSGHMFRSSCFSLLRALTLHMNLSVESWLTLCAALITPVNERNR